MKIIFNADDYGYSRGVNLGIIEACENGPVRSATMMANTPGFAHGAGLLAHAPHLRIGVHLVLTYGIALGGGYKTITDADGNFFTKNEVESRAMAGEIDLNEVEREYALQIKKILDAGIRPTHFDGHHHTHILSGIADVTYSFARKYSLPVRMCNQPNPPDIKAIAFADTFFGDNATVSHLDFALANLSADTEFMCHPAYIDSYLHAKSSYCLGRMGELATLTNPAVMTLIDKYGHVLANYADIQEGQNGLE